MELTNNINIGQVVKSKTGRDAGGIFLVYKVLDSEYVEIVDGKRRTLEKPKKKKMKHLIVYKAVEEIHTNILDAHIQKLLKQYI